MGVASPALDLEDAGALQLEGPLSHPMYRPFMQADWSVAEHTSSVLAGSHTTAQAESEHLREGVRVLDAQLATEVSGRSTELLRNVRRMLDAERSLADVVLSVESLQSAITRIRAEITGPYEHIKARTQQLRALHATVELLRQLIHRIKLVQKLRAQMSAAPGALDLAKAAKLLTDIHGVDRESDLQGIHAIASDEEFITSAESTIREQAQAALQDGMESMSQAKVGSALQVYFNLDGLQQAVARLMSQHLQKIEKLAKAALDAKVLSALAGGAPTTNLLGMSGTSRTAGVIGQGGAGSWQEKLWSGLKEVADAVASATTAVWHLQRVVIKKKDPLTHVCFIDVLVPSDHALLCQQFWESMMRTLSEAFTAVTRPSAKAGFVRDALVGGYPKLSLILETMFDRLSTETTMKGVQPAVGPHELQLLLASTGPIQATFLAGCLNRMSEAVVAAFPGGARSLPTFTEVQKCIGIIHEELKAGATSPQLSALVASTAGKALALLCEKAEYMSASGPDSRSPPAAPAPATPAQARNMALCSQLQEVHRSLGSLLPRLPLGGAAALALSLDTLQATAVETVAPLFRSMMELLEGKVLEMHALDFGAEDSSGVVLTSAYVTEAAAIMAHFRAEYLSKFVPVPSPTVASCAGALVERMAARALVFFVRHASLVRPLGQAGRLQLAKDLGEMQLAVGTSLFPLEQLGQPYRVVKAFRSLLFADTAAIPSAGFMRELPSSIVAHHLFSRLPPRFQAPHERSGLNPSQYSLWLDSHTQEEAVRGLQAALGTALPQGSGEVSEATVQAMQVITLVCEQAAM